MALRFGLNNKIKPKLLINIGALFDVPTSSLVIGNKGETIFNGGLGFVTAVVGAGNNYKSTILHYMMLSAGDRIRESYDTGMSTYDTEVNITIDRLQYLAKNFKHLPNDLIVGEDRVWELTDKSLSPANKWAMDVFDYAAKKVKDTSIMVDYTAFVDPYTKGPLKMVLPTFAEIDSMTEFEGEATSKMLDGDLEDSSTNTFAMKQGLFKMKFMSRLPSVSTSSNTFFLMTAQIGTKINMDTGPMAKYNQPTKKLQYLKSSDDIKGVSSKFSFLLNNGWFAHTATVLKNQATKLPEYPKVNDNSNATDLNTVKLTQLRSKSGPSGYTLEIVVSQTEGVLPALTEFHHIKTNGKYGIEGSNLSYNIVFKPDTKLSRTTVRRKIDDDAKLRRAINIASELLQVAVFMPNIKEEGLYCEPKELYDDIAAMGYDWEKLLDSRGYWLIDQYSKKSLPFLSVIDLLKMRKGLYKPYWYDLTKD